jgi:hypothetical protein
MKKTVRGESGATREGDGSDKRNPPSPKTEMTCPQKLIIE